MPPHDHDVNTVVLGTAAFRRPRMATPILPDDIIADILLRARLPLKHLLQLRRVCKSWKTVISSPQFGKDHLQCSIADPTMTHLRLSYCNDDIYDPKIGICSVESLFQKPSGNAEVLCFRTGRSLGNILGSCNGLLCLYDLLHNCVRLWNPRTKLTSQWMGIDGTRRCCSRYFGFGYDHVHDKYKLFVACYPIDDAHVESVPAVTKVCTFGGVNSWATVRDIPFRPYSCTAKFLSGSLNWVAKKPGANGRWAILSFDLGNGTYDSFAFPPISLNRRFDAKLFSPRLQVLKGSLCLCFNHKRTDWVVWLMKEFGVAQSWTRLAVISHPELRNISYLEPLYISEDDVILMRHGLSTIFFYNTGSKNGGLIYPMIDSYNDGMPECLMSKDADQTEFHVYHETLISPSNCGLQSFSSESSMLLIK